MTRLRVMIDGFRCAPRAARPQRGGIVVHPRLRDVPAAGVRRSSRHQRRPATRWRALTERPAVRRRRCLSDRQQPLWRPTCPAPLPLCHRASASSSPTVGSTAISSTGCHASRRTVTRQRPSTRHGRRARACIGARNGLHDQHRLARSAKQRTEPKSTARRHTASASTTSRTKRTPRTNSGRRQAARTSCAMAERPRERASRTCIRQCCATASPRRSDDVLLDDVRRQRPHAG